jgi:hypothetical protein
VIDFGAVFSLEATLPAGSDTQLLGLASVDSLADPVGDVAGAEAEMAADTEPRWAVAAVAPGVDGGDGDAEVVGEVLDGEETVEGVHAEIVREDPVTRMPATLSRTLSETLQLPMALAIGRDSGGRR